MFISGFQTVPNCANISERYIPTFPNLHSVSFVYKHDYTLLKVSLRLSKVDSDDLRAFLGLSESTYSGEDILKILQNIDNSVVKF